MSVRAIAAMWDEAARLQLSSPVILVGLALADHASNDGTGARPSQATIAAMTALSVRSVRRHLAELERVGVVEQYGTVGATGRVKVFRFVALADRWPDSMRPHSPDSTPSADNTNRPHMAGPGSGNPVTLSANADKHDTPHHIQDPVLNRKASHDAMTAGIVQAFRLDPDRMTETEWGRVHKAAKLLVDVNAEPGEVAEAVALYRGRYPSVACTPLAVAGRWSELTAPTVCPHTAKAWTLTDVDGSPVEVLVCGDCRTELDRRVA